MTGLAFLVSTAFGATLVGRDNGGADLVVADGDTLQGVFTNVGRFEIAAGTTVYVSGGTPLVVYADEIVVAGTLDGVGAGYAGGLGPGDGLSGNKGGAGGGSYGGHGGRGGGGESTGYCSLEQEAGFGSGPPYGSSTDPVLLDMGSGGGSGDLLSGAAGGGAVFLDALTLTIPVGGEIRVHGGNGATGSSDDGAPGGGAGGGIVLQGTTLTVEGVLGAAGGNGGASVTGWYCDGGDGGGGGGGRILLFGAMTSVPPEPVVPGGTGGRPGARGTVYIDDLASTSLALAVSGACAATHVEVTGASAFGEVALVMGPTSGADALPAGVCAGVVSGLAAPEKPVTLQADGDGLVIVDTHKGAQCGKVLQAVDLSTCVLSAAVLLP